MGYSGVVVCECGNRYLVEFVEGGVFPRIVKLEE